MPTIRYRSPNDPAFIVFDQTRFRLEHGTFLLRPDDLARQITRLVESRSGWNLVAMKLLAEDHRLRACLEWLQTLGREGDAVIVPALVHEPALDLVADGLIVDRLFEWAACPVCSEMVPADAVAVKGWDFTEDGVTVRGRLTTCPQGHPIHAMTDGIDGLDFEGPD